MKCVAVLPSSSDSLLPFRTFTARVMDEALPEGADADEAWAFTLAVHEGLTNILRHTDSSELRVEYEVQGDSLLARLRDTGPGFHPDEVERPDFEDPRPGGYGLFLVGELVDEVTYEDAPIDGGNDLVLRKHVASLSPPGSPKSLLSREDAFLGSLLAAWDPPSAPQSLSLLDSGGTVRCSAGSGWLPAFEEGETPRAVDLPDGWSVVLERIDAYGTPWGWTAWAGPGEPPAGFQGVCRAAALYAEGVHEIDDMSASLTRLFEEHSFLYEIGSILGASRNVTDFTEGIARRAAVALGVPMCAVVLPRVNDPETFYLSGAYGIDRPRGTTVDLGPLTRFLEPGAVPAVMRPDTTYTGVTGTFQESILAAPLRSASGDTAGLLLFADRPGGFASEEERFTGFVAEVLGGLLTGVRLLSLERDVGIASRIVDNLLPDADPVVAGWDVAGALRPARIVGGDYYDFLQDGATTTVVVADVAGHALPATLQLTVVRSALRWVWGTDAGPGAVVEQMAAVLYEDLSRSDTFLSLFLMDVAGDGRITYANAGHPPALLVRADGTSRQLDAEGMVMGVAQETEHLQMEHRVEPGDRLVVLTDGVLEAGGMPTGEQFGWERVEGVLREVADLPAGMQVQAVLDAVEVYGTDDAERDDRTVVVLRYLGAPA